MMRRLLKVERNNYESEFFYTILIIGAFIFLSTFALYRIWGYRPVCFLKEENGVIAKMNDDQMFNLGGRRNDIELIRSYIYIDGNKKCYLYRKKN